MLQNPYNQEIDEMMQEQDEVFNLQQDETWRIRDLSTAVWADGIILENERKVEEIEAIYTQRLEAFKTKLDEWKDKASKKYLNNIDFFKTHLHVYHMRVLEDEIEKGAKKLSKTIQLPSRKLKCVKQQPEVFINGKEAAKAKDDPKFVEFVKANAPEHIKEEVKWGDFKKTLKQQMTSEGKLVYVDENGEVLDFVQLIEREDKYDWEKVKSE